MTLPDDTQPTPISAVICWPVARGGITDLPDVRPCCECDAAVYWQPSEAHALEHDLGVPVVALCIDCAISCGPPYVAKACARLLAAHYARQN